jgi:hypothetical protein
MWTALSLLLLLAVVSAVGTFVPLGGGGSPFFQSWAFRLLLGLLAVNLGGCLWWRRGRIRLLPLLSHLLLLLVMALALAGSLLGTVGTQNIPVGGESATFYSWEEDADLPLPFTVMVDRFATSSYPRALQIGVRDTGSGEKKALILTHLGGTFDIPGVRGRFQVRSYNPSAKDILVAYLRQWEKPAVLVGGSVIPGTRLEMLLVAEMPPPPEAVRELYAEVSLSRGGTVVRAGRVSPNHPLSFEGTDVYLTAWGEDRFHNPFVGLQFVRDPVRPWTMGAAGLFALAVTAALLLRRQR